MCIRDSENNDVFTMEDEPIASVVQDMRKGSKWLSAFLESYRPPPVSYTHLDVYKRQSTNRLYSVSSLLFSRISLCSSTVGANSSRSDFAHRTRCV